MPAETFALETLAALCGARVARSAATPVRGLALDSRRVRQGNLFVALPNRPEAYLHDVLNDGLPHAPAAARAGASAVLAEREVVLPEGTGLLVAENAFDALRRVGFACRGAFRGELVGVVGSCGKTTAKNFAAEVLSRSMRVVATEGNRNNLLGVPETLANADTDAGAWIVEMGISSPGEMAELAAGVEPTAVLFTTVQPVHTEFFSGLEAIRDEKAGVLNHLRPGGLVAVNADDPLLADLPVPAGARRISYGFCDRADIRIEATGTPGPHGVPFLLRHAGRTAVGSLPVPGLHHLANFCGVAAVGVTLGVDLGVAAKAAASLKPAPHRGELVPLPGDILMLDDSYNANPAAVESVLRTVCGWGRPVLAALGEMRELGPASLEHHRRVGEMAAALGLRALLCVGGEGARALGDAFAAGGGEVLRTGRWEDGKEWLAGRLRGGDAVLVKGSRFWGLDRLCAWLVSGGAP